MPSYLQRLISSPEKNRDKKKQSMNPALNYQPHYENLILILCEKNNKVSRPTTYLKHPHHSPLRISQLTHVQPHETRHFIEGQKT